MAHTFIRKNFQFKKNRGTYEFIGKPKEKLPQIYRKEKQQIQRCNLVYVQNHHNDSLIYTAVLNFKKMYSLNATNHHYKGTRQGSPSV